MITSVFSKSKPINIVLVLSFITILFVIHNFNLLFADYTSFSLGILRLILCLFSMFLLNFMVSKNKLTKKNTYAVLIFGLLFGMFPELLKNTDLLITNIFMMLGLRRLLSLHSNKHIKKKLFEAGFWIGMASLFFFWAILFFALVIVALIYYSQSQIKNLVIPFVGLLLVVVLLICYNIIYYDVYFRATDFERLSSLDFAKYNSTSSIIKLTVLLTSYLWSIFYFFGSVSQKNNKLKPVFYMVAWGSVLALLIFLVTPFKNNGELVFLFTPFSIIMANYLETIKDRWFKEVFVMLFLLTPVLGLLL